MSGQCLSPDVAVQPLSPATRHCLGGPLPRQLADRTWADLRQAGLAVPALWSPRDASLRLHPVLATLSSCYSGVQGTLPMHYSPFRHYTHIATRTVRLACLSHAASVRSEPGSNSSTKFVIYNGVSADDLLAFGGLPTAPGRTSALSQLALRGRARTRRISLGPRATHSARPVSCSRPNTLTLSWSRFTFHLSEISPPRLGGSRNVSRTTAFARPQRRARTIFFRARPKTLSIRWKRGFLDRRGTGVFSRATFEAGSDTCQSQDFPRSEASHDCAATACENTSYRRCSLALA